MPRSEMGRLITDGKVYASCCTTMAQSVSAALPTNQHKNILETVERSVVPEKRDDEVFSVVEILPPCLVG